LSYNFVFESFPNIVVGTHTANYCGMQEAIALLSYLCM